MAGAAGAAMSTTSSAVSRSVDSEIGRGAGCGTRTACHSPVRQTGVLSPDEPVPVGFRIVVRRRRPIPSSAGRPSRPSASTSACFTRRSPRSRSDRSPWRSDPPSGHLVDTARRCVPLTPLRPGARQEPLVRAVIGISSAWCADPGAPARRRSVMAEGSPGRVPDGGPPSPRPQVRRPAADTRDAARLGLVIGALGVVFGDIGTSPIYTLQTVFNPDDPHPVPVTARNVFGVVSLVFWSVMIIVTGHLRAAGDARRQRRRGRHHGADHAAAAVGGEAGPAGRGRAGGAGHLRRRRCSSATA